MSEKQPKDSASLGQRPNTVLDTMNELYNWLVIWDKDVNKTVRKRDEDTTEEKRRKKVVCKKTSRFQA